MSNYACYLKDALDLFAGSRAYAVGLCALRDAWVNRRAQNAMAKFLESVRAPHPERNQS